MTQAGLRAQGIHDPSPIQAAAIARLLSGRNAAVQSHTGSGKTLAYLLPLMTRALQAAELHMASEQAGRPLGLQGLVVAPSQELAMQIVRVAQSLMPKEGRSAVQQCIGGANPHRQREALQKHEPLLVVGTPGRLAEFVRGGVLRLHGVCTLVLDEADQLLAPHFAEDMAKINEHAGKRLAGGSAGSGSGSSRQTVTVSATLSKSVMTKLSRWSPDAEYISVEGQEPVLAPPPSTDAAAARGAAGAEPGWGWGAKGWDGPASAVAPRGTGSAGGAEQDSLVPSLPAGLRHYYVVVDARRKTDVLRRLIHALDVQRALVFMNFQQRTADVQYKLEARDLGVASLHGEMPKMQRQNVLASFRQGKLRALIVSDVVARGLDVSGCDAVFNLELPSSGPHYAHRAGRTGRLGSATDGVVISVITPSERFVVERLADRLNTPILEAHVGRGEFKLGPDPEMEQQWGAAAAARSAAAAAASSSAAAASQRQMPAAASDDLAAQIAGRVAAKSGSRSAGEAAASSFSRGAASLSGSAPPRGSVAGGPKDAQARPGAASFKPPASGALPGSTRKVRVSEVSVAAPRQQGAAKRPPIDLDLGNDSDDEDDDADKRRGISELIKSELSKELQEIKSEKGSRRGSGGAAAQRQTSARPGPRS